MVGGNFATEQLHGILEEFRELSGLPNTPRSACRCGDSSNDLLRKILFVVRTDAGLPDIPSTEWRPGDNTWQMSIKILGAVNVAGSEGCRCGDSLHNLWCKILDAVRESFGLPHVAAFSCRPGDSLNDLLRKLLLLLQHSVVVIPCECPEQNDWMTVSGTIVCCEDWGDFSGPIMECEDWGNV